MHTTNLSTFLSKILLRRKLTLHFTRDTVSEEIHNTCDNKFSQNAEGKSEKEE